MNTAPHFDLEYGKTKEFGRTLMNSTFTLAVLLGIVSADHPGLLREVSAARLSAPLFGGDSLRVSSTVVEGGDQKRLLSTGFNQDDIAVIEVEHLIASVPSGDELRRILLAEASSEPTRAPVARRVKPVIAPHFEAFSPGDQFEHGAGRTILADEAIWMALLSMSRDPVSFDRHWARSLGLQDLLVDRGFLLSLVLGLSVKHTTQDAVANLGWRRARFFHPVFPDDTIYAATTVLDARRSRSRPSQGVVTVETEGRNQNGQTVVSFERAFLTTAGQSEPRGDAHE